MFILDLNAMSIWPNWRLTICRNPFRTINRNLGACRNGLESGKSLLSPSLPISFLPSFSGREGDTSRVSYGHPSPHPTHPLGAPLAPRPLAPRLSRLRRSISQPPTLKSCDRHWSHTSTLKSVYELTRGRF